MTDLLDLSARIIDTGVCDVAVNRTNQELSEVAEDVAVVESFSHCVVVRTDEGLVLFDASGAGTGAEVVDAVRRWSDEPVHTLVYTHGHLDHVGGSGAVLADAARRGHPAPRVIAHENVPGRLSRYRGTAGYNMLINMRQFGWLMDPGRTGGTGSDELRPSFDAAPREFVPSDVALPDTLVGDALDLSVGGLDIGFRHARGETDDHLWSWLPGKRAVSTGDLLIWNFPNAGNPQKVQRYPDEWATALRAIVAEEPELLLPAHGLPIGGRDRIAAVLGETADVLDALVAQTLELMNAGAPLDTVLHTVSVPEVTLAKPFLQPLYDEPEFVVRNIWRLYGGWYDGNPARLKPAADATVAAEVARLAGGAAVLVERAEESVAAGDLRLARQLVEWAAGAAPDDAGVQRARAAVYATCSEAEGSLMAKGIFAFESTMSAGRGTGA
ncbi:Metallo-beta-lactamase superfamily protein [Pseudonocardia sp. Ae168_Ps1]|uniref:alkyl sulfatase dimerization domain-containing protein n=1 Tax=unclassified Pseudonocardia TaxID=2619320 RepID=UPI00094AC0DC|nr:MULTISPECIES: alkyl sulfatase dimerization domain-containing protein [unclassified Pseudonocardia]OLL76843.1 Metallo-beta-lactamase superfamily protein [Pseudonocardia sp. Ae150A_Ps1]OLL82857.1 Metallo-beta-lactamase superfamily protein [Pseudonocardia sp. Ae168_Ps1]OLL83031.1 Metallo-beta-lactamase superfamily protein [Pseudonocardia sp. Ae263_Ps1]OLL90930.1 Metallo-beta-lactamase superfamily protein [Pseudonocardia sp. Ae356_Ps1]